MKDRDSATKKKIVDSAIKLILQGEAANMTVRGIASEAGVGPALVNYHFHTKENLIDIALDTFFTKALESGQSNLEMLVLPADEKLRFSLKGYGAFLAMYPGISRTYILNSLVRNIFDDSGDKVIKHQIPLLKELFKDRDDAGLIADLMLIIGTIQMIFLRSEEFKRLTDIDFFNDRERDSFIDGLTDRLFDMEVKK